MVSPVLDQLQNLLHAPKYHITSYSSLQKMAVCVMKLNGQSSIAHDDLRLKNIKNVA